MAQLKLNTTSSIVDFLKAKGMPSDFSSRSKMFRESGLESRLGSFVGSASQNLALLKNLQQKETAPLVSTLPIPSPVSPVETPRSIAERALGITVPMGQQTPEQRQSIREQVAKQRTERIVPSPTATQAFQEAGLVVPKEPTAEEITKQVEERIKPFEERKMAGLTVAEAEAKMGREAAESQFESDKNELEQKLSERGLTFSGIRNSQIAGLQQNLAARLANIDVKLAATLLDANFDFRDRIQTEVANVIKDAQQGRKEAIDQLNKSGLAIVGNKLVPTITALETRRREEVLKLQREKFEKPKTIKPEKEISEFTRAQTQKGAAVANIPIRDFEELDADTKNFFINNSEQIKSKKKLIDEAKSENQDPTSIEKEISLSDLPSAVKDTLVKHLWSVFPRDKQKSLPWWRRIF